MLEQSLYCKNKCFDAKHKATLVLTAEAMLLIESMKRKCKRQDKCLIPYLIM